MHVNDIQETRRAQLKLWFATRSIPPKEKSYISQLLKGDSSFGEKAARRLEESYGMGKHYLDGVAPQIVQLPTPSAGDSQATSGTSSKLLQEAIYLLQLFNNADERGRNDILRMAEMFSKRHNGDREVQADPVGHES